MCSKPTVVKVFKRNGHKLGVTVMYFVPPSIGNKNNVDSLNAVVACFL